VYPQRFRTVVARKVTQLLSTAPPPLGPDQLSARGDSLPAPVRRYLRYAVPEGVPAIRTAHLKHDGFFRTRPSQRWLPIQGEEYFTVAEPGFVWHATVRPASLLWIEACDSLLAGRGNMLVKFISIFTIAGATGPEIDQGARLRWLGEMIWFPSAFAGERIRWEPINDRSARATLLADGLPVSAVVEFDQEGKLVTLRAARYRDLGGGGAALTPWVARCADYCEFSGFRVPSSVEVLWDLEDAEFSYARFHVTALEYSGA
jgi:hypothetical protein